MIKPKVGSLLTMEVSPIPWSDGNHLWRKGWGAAADPERMHPRLSFWNEVHLFTRLLMPHMLCFGISHQQKIPKEKKGEKC